VTLISITVFQVFRARRLCTGGDGEQGAGQRHMGIAAFWPWTPDLIRLSSGGDNSAALGSETIKVSRTEDNFTRDNQLVLCLN